MIHKNIVKKSIASILMLLFTMTTVYAAPASLHATSDGCLSSFMRGSEVASNMQSTMTAHDRLEANIGKADAIIAKLRASQKKRRVIGVQDDGTEVYNGGTVTLGGIISKGFKGILNGILRSPKSLVLFILGMVFTFIPLADIAAQPDAVLFAQATPTLTPIDDARGIMADDADLYDAYLRKDEDIIGEDSDVPGVDDDPETIQKRQQAEYSMSMVRALLFSVMTVSDVDARVDMVQYGLVELVRPEFMTQYDVQKIGNILFTDAVYAPVRTALMQQLGFAQMSELQTYLSEYNRFSVSNVGGEEKVAGDFHIIYETLTRDETIRDTLLYDLAVTPSILGSDARGTYNARGYVQPHQFDQYGMQIPDSFRDDQWAIIQGIVEKYNSVNGATMRQAIQRYFGNERGVRIRVTATDLEYAQSLDTLDGTQHIAYDDMLRNMMYITPQQGLTVTNKRGSTLTVERYLPGQRLPGNIMAFSEVRVATADKTATEVDPEKGISIFLGWYENEHQKSWRFTNSVYTLLNTNPEMREVIKNLGGVWETASEAIDGTTTVRAWVQAWYRLTRDSERAAGNTGYNASAFGKAVTQAFNVFLAHPYNRQNKANEFSMPVGGIYFVPYEFSIPEKEIPEFFTVFAPVEILLEELIESQPAMIMSKSMPSTAVQSSTPLLSPDMRESDLYEAAQNQRQMSNPDNTPTNSELADSLNFKNYGMSIRRFGVETSGVLVDGVFSLTQAERTVEEADLKGLINRSLPEEEFGNYTDVLSKYSSNTIDYENWYGGLRYGTWEFGFKHATFLETTMQDAAFGRRIIDAERSRDFLTGLTLSEESRTFDGLVLKKQFPESKMPFSKVSMRLGKLTEKNGAYLFIPEAGSMGLYAGDTLTTFNQQFDFAGNALRDSLVFDEADRFAFMLSLYSKPLLLPFGFDVMGAARFAIAPEFDMRMYGALEGDFGGSPIIVGTDYLFDLDNNYRFQAWLGFNARNLNKGVINSGPMYFLPKFSPQSTERLWASASMMTDYYGDLMVSQAKTEYGVHTGYRWLGAFAKHGVLDFGRTYNEFGLTGAVHLGNHILVSAMVGASGQDRGAYQLNFGGGLSFMFGNTRNRPQKKYDPRTPGAYEPISRLFNEVVPASLNVAEGKRGSLTRSMRSALDTLTLNDGYTPLTVREQGYGDEYPFLEGWNKAALDLQVNLDSTVVSREQVRDRARTIMTEERMPALPMTDSIAGKIMVFSVATERDTAYSVVAVYANDGQILVDVAEGADMDEPRATTIANMLLDDYWAAEDAFMEGLPENTFAVDTVSAETMNTVMANLLSNTDSISDIMTSLDTNAVVLKYQAQDSSFFSVSFFQTNDSSDVSIAVGTLDEGLLHNAIGRKITTFSDARRAIDHALMDSALVVVRDDLKPRVDLVVAQDSMSVRDSALVTLYEATVGLIDAAYAMTDTSGHAVYEQAVRSFHDAAAQFPEDDEIITTIRIIDGELYVDESWLNDLAGRIEKDVRIHWEHDFDGEQTFVYDYNGRPITVTVTTESDAGEIKVRISAPVHTETAELNVVPVDGTETSAVTPSVDPVAAEVAIFKAA